MAKHCSHGRPFDSSCCQCGAFHDAPTLENAIEIATGGIFHRHDPHWTVEDAKRLRAELAQLRQANAPTGDPNS